VAVDWAVRCMGSSQERVQDFPEIVADPVGIDRDHEADSVIACPEVHDVVVAINDADAFPENFCQAGHVDVVQLPLDVAGFNQCDVTVLFRVVGMIGEVAVGGEPFQQLLHDRSGGVVFGELVQIGKGLIYLSMQAVERGRDPMTRHAAREQSLEGMPESTGYVLFIPDCGGQGEERGHISDCLSDRRSCGCFEKKTR
jgi:hypothetical protein